MSARLVEPMKWHGGDLASPMPADQQEAESRKYGNVGVWLVPLKSGNWGVFDGAYGLVGTTSGGLVGEEELRALAVAGAERIRAKIPMTAASEAWEADEAAVGSVASPEDLGL